MKRKGFGLFLLAKNDITDNKDTNSFEIALLSNKIINRFLLFFIKKPLTTTQIIIKKYVSVEYFLFFYKQNICIYIKYLKN